jgi:hypothetical protein
LTSALGGGEGSASRTGRTLPPVQTRYPFYRRLGGPQSRSGQVLKISPPPGFDPRTVQPVGSRYTDYATRPTLQNVISIILHTNTQPECLGHHVYGMGVQASSRKAQHTLLWVGSRATSRKITMRGIAWYNIAKISVIFTVNLHVRGPRVRYPRYRAHGGDNTSVYN